MNTSWLSAQIPHRYRMALAALAVVTVTVLIYWPGLGGPFLFDDEIRITKNPKVQITDLSFASLKQAWTSSYAYTPPPGGRELSQLTFGINHVFGGLSPTGYKATSLAVHLINGYLLFLLARVLASAWSHGREIALSPQRVDLFALVAATLWLIHPLNLSTVLYVNQRSTELAALFVFAGMWMYTGGRLALARGEAGLRRMLLAFPVAGIGLLAKENAALFPLLLLTLEWTLLRDLPLARNATSAKWLRRLGLGLPLALGLVYLITHPGILSYATRPFTMDERLLTQARLLWFYLQLFIVPTTPSMGFIHDDIAISHGLFQPITTFIAVAAWFFVTGLALTLSRRLPWFAFAVLFYLAAHFLESSIFPLEMAFEHRNYVPTIAVSMLLARFLVIPLGDKAETPRLFSVLTVLLALLFASTTLLRANDWRDKVSFIFTEVEHHPDSLRNNFRAGQLYVDLVASDRLTEEEKADSYQAARGKFEKMLALAPGMPDALIGLIVLDLNANKPPEPAWIDQLEDSLRTSISLDPTRLTISQFSFLVRWQLSDAPTKLDQSTLPRLFAAVFDNPRLPKMARANLHLTRAKYRDLVLHKPALAIEDARTANRLWPRRWLYPRTEAELALRLGHLDEAAEVVDKALQRGLEAKYRQQAMDLRNAIERARSNAAQPADQ